jgi:cysteine-S-conjugate beta-lyase
MSPFNRRAFLRNVPLSALAGAAGVGFSRPAEADEPSTTANGKFDFDTPYNRVGTDSIKWDYEIRRYGLKRIVAGMGVADIDFPCAPAITKALQERIHHEVWGYLDMPKSFVEGVVKWNKRRYNLDIDPEMIGIATGVHPGINATLKAFCPPGSKVLLTTPTYNGFYSDISFNHLVPNESLMKVENGRYTIDFEDFERRIDRETNVFILCNPQNPTGNTWSREELTRLGEICLRRRVLVLADEIHCDFVNGGGKYTPFASLENRDIVNNSITFKAASKSFGLAAMKCGWFFSTNPEIVRAAKANNRADLSTLGMIANKAAYAEGEEWLNQCVAYIDGNHDFVQSYFRTNNMSGLIKPLAKAHGTYLMWLDVTGLSKKIGAQEMARTGPKEKDFFGELVQPSTEDVIASWLAHKSGCTLNSGTTYGKGGENHLRMNIGTSRKTLKAALDSISQACKKA